MWIYTITWRVRACWDLFCDRITQASNLQQMCLSLLNTRARCDTAVNPHTTSITDLLPLSFTDKTLSFSMAASLAAAMNMRGWRGRKEWSRAHTYGKEGPYLVEGCDFKTERWGMECKGSRTMESCVFLWEAHLRLPFLSLLVGTFLISLPRRSFSRHYCRPVEFSGGGGVVVVEQLQVNSSHQNGQT